MEKKALLEQYFDGFRTGSQAKVLSCLTDDVVWRLHGCQTFKGKAAVEADISNDEFKNGSQLVVHQYIEERERIVALGSGSISQESGDPRCFTFCEVFVFEQGLIREIDTFHVWEK